MQVTQSLIDIDTEKAVLEILSICLRLKAAGVDAFFNYFPHVNRLDVQVFDGEWREAAKPTCFTTYLDGQCGSPVEYSLASIKSYLQALLPPERIERSNNNGIL